MGKNTPANEAARHAHDWLFELIGTSRELLHTLGDGLWRVPGDPVDWAWKVKFWAGA